METLLGESWFAGNWRVTQRAEFMSLVNRENRGDVKWGSNRKSVGITLELQTIPLMLFGRGWSAVAGSGALQQELDPFLCSASLVCSCLFSYLSSINICLLCPPSGAVTLCLACPPAPAAELEAKGPPDSPGAWWLLSRIASGCDGSSKWQTL